MDVLEQRQILIEWVACVVSRPSLLLQDPGDPDLMHAYGLISERGGRVLRVVCNPDEDSDVVVTAFFDRSMKLKHMEFDLT